MAGGRGGDRGGRRAGPGSTGGPQPPRKAGGLNLRRLDDGAFELVHPRCVEEMEPDYVEGLELRRAGEPEEARDALRYALQGCGDNIWVHVALGTIALEDFNDPSLARGHFGYAFELARKAIPNDFAGPLPPALPRNRPLYDAINGLLACHERLGDPAAVAELRTLADRWVGRGRE